MSKHTKGPWRVGGKTKFINQLSIEPTIGVVYGSGDELIANANLIAAAPELLEACIRFCEKVESGRARSVESYAQMKAAIEKAKGDV